MAFAPEIVPCLEIGTPKYFAGEARYQCGVALYGLDGSFEGVLMLAKVVTVVVFAEIACNHYLLHEELAQFGIGLDEGVCLIETEHLLHRIHECSCKLF